MFTTAFWRRLAGRASSLAGDAAPLGPASPAAPRPAALRCVVLQEGAATPSGDYLLLPWLERMGLPLLLADVRMAPPAGVLRRGDLVVVSRYLDDAWKRTVAAREAELAGLVYFMDDDLFDGDALAGLAEGYARKLRKLALAHRPWLEAHADAFWVSTPALAQKYAALSPVVLPLAPGPALRAPAALSVRIGYHGTASHRAELDWLRGVLADVQARCDFTHVEVFGDHPVNRQWRDLPRTAVLHPMRWEQYRDYTASHALDIGLAPLLPGAFNAARGAVKFHDYARMGAVGLYADVPPYRGFVRDGVDGLLLPAQDAAAWVDAIVALAGDAARRQALRAAAMARAAARD